MLIDEIEVTLKAGDGGEGIVSFGKMAKSGPDGGNGGHGADIYIVGSSDLTLLKKFSSQPIIEADNGGRGGQNKKTGKNTTDLEIVVPIGTSMTDSQSGEVFEVNEINQKVLVCKGGKGGTGNYDLRSPRLTTPKKTIPAEHGQARELKVVLSFIADFGLIGLPSAGKSSLLNEITKAKAKTAEYHFTTLSPNLGVLSKSGKIVADIPGLIEGAHEGKGLGIKFLKHVEKVKLLLHCISADSENPSKDYDVIRKELMSYDESLTEKKEIILITKHDLVEKDTIHRAKLKLESKGLEVMVTSIYDPDSIENLIEFLEK